MEPDTLKTAERLCRLAREADIDIVIEPETDGRDAWFGILDEDGNGMLVTVSPEGER